MKGSREVKVPSDNRLGVIVNRVDCARMIYEKLQSERGEYELILVTGRMRPLDRARLDDDIKRCASESDQRSPMDRPIIIVSTQTLEAGADLDFEAIVTECAALDALRQRFGRLNRMGHDQASRKIPPSVILVRSDQVKNKAKADPIYEDSLSKTWSWLKGLADNDIIDFSILKLDVQVFSRSSVQGIAAHRLSDGDGSIRPSFRPLMCFVDGFNSKTRTHWSWTRLICSDS